MRKTILKRCLPALALLVAAPVLGQVAGSGNVFVQIDETPEFLTIWEDGTAREGLETDAEARRGTWQVDGQNLTVTWRVPLDEPIDEFVVNDETLGHEDGDFVVGEKVPQVFIGNYIAPDGRLVKFNAGRFSIDKPGGGTLTTGMFAIQGTQLTLRDLGGNKQVLTAFFTGPEDDRTLWLGDKPCRPAPEAEPAAPGTVSEEGLAGVLKTQFVHLNAGQTTLWVLKPDGTHTGMGGQGTWTIAEDRMTFHGGDGKTSTLKITPINETEYQLLVLDAQGNRDPAMPELTAVVQ
jgi:hypothetical protein